jgi:phosphatidylglycerol:prolipoprotein diacylglycerol transferase
MDKTIMCHMMQSLFSIPFPVTLSAGGSKIPLHIITEVLSTFLGFRYFLYLKKKKGDPVESSNRVWILIAATFGALIGSRLLGALENPVAWWQSGNMLLYAYQQKTVVGGLLGGLFCVEFSKFLLKEKTASGDLFVYPFILAMLLGRVGCFSMGVYEETYGLPTSFPLGMNLGDGLKRHPVALYEIGFWLLLWISLHKIEKRFILENGALFKMMMIAYFTFRLLLDFIKPHVTHSIGLSSIQIASIIGLAWYGRYLLRPKILLAT